MDKIYNKVKFITGIVVVFFSIMVAGLSIHEEVIGQSNNFIEIKVPCYDSNHNKIMGVTCKEKVYTYDLTKINKFRIIYMIVILSMLLINMIDDNEKTDFFGIKYKQKMDLTKFKEYIEKNPINNGTLKKHIKISKKREKERARIKKRLNKTKK